MSPCPKCGGKQWAGPKFIVYGGNDRDGKWPCWPSDTPHNEALIYACATCGYAIFLPTVENGGEPVPEPAPKPRKTDKKAS